MGTMLMAKKPKGKSQPQTTIKSHIPFATTIGKLAKLKGTSVPAELDEYLKDIEDELLTELAREKADIEQSRRGSKP